MVFQISVTCVKNGLNVNLQLYCLCLHTVRAILCECMSNGLALGNQNQCSLFKKKKVVYHISMITHIMFSNLHVFIIMNSS